MQRVALLIICWPRRWLPVVAAKVELEGARASAQLLVCGYKNSTLGGMLPAWQSFGVDC